MRDIEKMHHLSTPYAFDDKALAEQIREDAACVRQFALHTPLVRLSWLSTPRRTVWAKLECHQLTNSFKIRGAYNAIRKLPARQPVYTASAGNHGLAVAYAARALGRSCIVHVPVNASELKLRRLSQEGASVEPAGRDLHEAIAVAKARAAASGGAYISPFAHEDVIRGQGSLAVEVLEDLAEPIDAVIAPLGGGGLIAGIAPVFKAHRPGTRVIGVHPAIFQRDLSGYLGEGLSKPVRPTVADGLAVQHEECDHPLEARVRMLLDGIDTADEAEIEQAVVGLLHNESVLCEGAGAIAAVPLMRDLDAVRISGNVVVVISGGNIASATLMRCFMTQADDARTATLLGHRSARLAAETVRREGPARAHSPGFESSGASVREDIWSPLLATLSIQFRTLLRRLQEHLEYADHHRLDTQRELVEHLAVSVDHALERLAATQRRSASPSERRAVYRLLIQEYAFLGNSLSWCSASSDQSRCVMFFDPRENASSSVNYDRYGSHLLRDREIALLRSLGFDAARNDLLLVSSGQAAYAVIESFLLSEVLPPGTTVVTSPYIYFEALEQLQRLRHIALHRARSWGPDALIDLVEEHNARVVFVDPLANLGTMDAFDLRAFAARLRGHDWSDRWLVIDGTMVSGGFDVFSIFDSAAHPNILYYESGSKYLQLGLDLQMAGVVVCRKSMVDKLAVARRNTGSVMYQSSICRFPHYDRDLYLARMAVLTRNAELLVQCLSDAMPLREHADTSYPRSWRALGWAHGGGVVAVRFREPGLNHYACLDALIEQLLASCRRADAALTKGVSFGFSTTRVSAAAAMADSMPPFLRFSVGEESEAEMLVLSEIIAKTLMEFVAASAALLV